MARSTIFWIVWVCCHTAPAPIPAQAEDEPIVSWKGEPDGRGTWAILTSCTITMTLCVYTALHLNIMPTNPELHGVPWSKWRRIQDSLAFRQFVWISLGLFAPELVVYVAWTQFSTARKLNTHVGEKLRKVSD